MHGYAQLDLITIRFYRGAKIKINLTSISKRPRRHSTQYQKNKS